MTVKNWCRIDTCKGHPYQSEQHLVDPMTGRYTCCGTDALRADAFHAAGCLNACPLPKDRLEAIVDANRPRLTESVRRGEEQLSSGEDLVTLDDLLADGESDV